MQCEPDFDYQCATSQGDADPDAGTDALNPDAADDTAAYRLKLSKWYQGTFTAIQHPIFWFLMNICRCLRSPMRHFFLFVQQQAKNCNEGEVLRQLVTGKLDELQDEYRELHKPQPNYFESHRTFGVRQVFRE